MRKIIFLDVDGTLVDYHNRIPESAIRAIRQARENGHLVYVCTGRSRAEMQPELWEIGLDGMIGGNGSYVEHQGKVVMHQLISKKMPKLLQIGSMDEAQSFTWKVTMAFLRVKTSVNELAKP